MTQLVSYESH